MAVKVRFNGGTLEAAAQKASAQAARGVFATLNARFQDAMGRKAWPYPSVTIRQTGEVAGSPRNIVDTGLLRASNIFRVQGTAASFTWAANYATAIHEGARLKGGGIIYPRPWTDVVLGRIKGVSTIQPYDYRQAFRDTWLKAFVREL